jgi:hypothetical protein
LINTDGICKSFKVKHGASPIALSLGDYSMVRTREILFVLLALSFAPAAFAQDGSAHAAPVRSSSVAPKVSAPTCVCNPQSVFNPDGSSVSGASTSLSESPGTGLLSGDAGETKAILPDALKDRKFEENTEITDPRLRAEAGSTSRYSVKATVGYAGPQIDNMSNPNTPNPDGTSGRHKTNLSGAIGVRLRIDRDRAINFGTGVAAVTPFQNLQRFDVNDPFVSYDITEKVHSLQVHLSPSIAIKTVPEDKAVGQDAMLAFLVGTVYDIGVSRWSLSMDTRIDYALYDRPYVKTDKRAVQGNVGLFPGVKYKVNDSLNVAASVGIGYLNPRSLGDQTALQPKTVNGRLGVGWAPKRDIYIYPYITMYPSALSFNTTSLNFSTIFSIL